MSRARESAKLIGSDRITIASNNNIGIGTTDPTADLNVSGTITADNFTKSDGSAVAGEIDITASLFS